MTAKTRKVRFPEQDEILGKIAGKHLVRQLRRNEIEEQFRVTPYQVGRKSGLLFEGESGRKIYVAQHSGTPPSGVIDFLLVKGNADLQKVENFSDCDV